MSRKTRIVQKNSIQTTNNPQDNKKYTIKEILVGIIVGIIPVLVTVIFSITNDRIGKLDDKIDALAHTVAEQSSQIIAMSTRLDSLQQTVESLAVVAENNRDDITALKEETAYLKARLEYIDPRTVYIDPAGGLVSTIATEWKQPQFLSSPKWQKGEVIAIDRDTGEEYTSDDLKDEKIVMMYQECGYDLFFCGQFDDLNQWNGNCILNAYKDGELEYIMDAVYENGILKSYKQAFISQSVGKDTWAISDRTNEGDYNSGDTWNYIRDSSVKKSFDGESFKEQDIINPNTLKSMINAPLIGHYKGNTRDGKYCDNTGDAYYISYFEDGTVRTIYSGRFDNGLFEDSTGNAWYITRDRGDNGKKTTPYMYYKGKFSGGEVITDKATEFENPLSKDRAEEIIKDYAFRNEIIWDVDGFNTN